MVAPRLFCLSVLATSLLAGSVYAQDASKPLNLALPPSSGAHAVHAFSAAPADATPVSAAPAPANAASANATPANASPGVYYGDTSGVPVAVAGANDPDATTEACDDATVNKPQVHGSVTTGVVAGNHFSGNYEAGSVSIVKPLGDCKHPTGTLSITVRGGQGHFGYSPRSH